MEMAAFNFIIFLVFICDAVFIQVVCVGMNPQHKILV